MGGKVLVFGSPQQRNLAEGVSREQGLAFATEVFGRALPVVEQTDTLLAIEPLSARTTNFIRTACSQCSRARGARDRGEIEDFD